MIKYLLAFAKRKLNTNMRNILRNRFVNSNKKGNETPDVRARYEATDSNLYHVASFYAATAPLEAKCILLSEWASQRQRARKKLKFSFVDVRKTYFNGAPYPYTIHYQTKRSESP